MPTYRVTITGRLEAATDPEEATAALGEKLGDVATVDVTTPRRRGQHHLKVDLSADGRTQADALAKAARLLARALGAEPVTFVRARVAPSAEN